jgi:uncharacterized membrane protein
MRRVPLDHRPSRPLEVGIKVQVGIGGLGIVFGNDRRLWRIIWIVARMLLVSVVFKGTYR